MVKISKPMLNTLGGILAFISLKAGPLGRVVNQQNWIVFFLAGLALIAYTHKKIK